MFSGEELEVFFDELDEKLDIIGQSLLVLEKDGFDADTVDEIFRAAHTIKGSSGIMGFEKMALLTHEMENLLDQVRQKKISIGSDLITLLFSCLDKLKVLQGQIQKGENEADVLPLVEKFRIFSQTETDSAAKKEQGKTDDFWCLSKDEIKDFQEKETEGYKLFGITVKFDPDCMMKSVRALIIYENLAGVGSLVKANPPREALEEEIAEDEVQLLLLSKREFNSIESLINTVGEVSSYDLRDISLEAATADPEPEPVETKESAENETPQGETAQGNEKLEKSTSHTVRVDIRKLDTLMNLIGELVIDRTRLTQINNIFENRYGADSDIASLRQISTHLARVTNELQEEIMKTRMMPIAQVFNRFPRLVRDLANRFGKEIQLIVEGKETELDRTLIEAITDPLVHLIRNSVDHGLELPEERQQAGKPLTGRVSLRARQQENHIVIEVEDDGRGIDPEKLKQNALKKNLITQERADALTVKEMLNLIFLPGFSTAQTVDDISGRGVGMDVVRRQIEQVNGIVDISTELGQGTRFTLKLPLTLAIIQSLLVASSDEIYAFPLSNVLETIKIESSTIQKVKDCEVIMLRERVLPLWRLRTLLDNEAAEHGEYVYVVVVSVDGEKIGMIVDSLIGEQEIVIKGLGDYLGKISGFAGATILGDGRVALILDVRSLVKEVVPAS